uniref:Uncharacterized protein n=2 Tax=Anguilla anguilla TaxID=7936 RepID=A0A0E9UM31_ANGAN
MCFMSASARADQFH